MTTSDLADLAILKIKEQLEILNSIKYGFRDYDLRKELIDKLEEAINWYDSFKED